MTRERSRGVEEQPRRDYESAALPLSYTGVRVRQHPTLLTDHSPPSAEPLLPFCYHWRHFEPLQADQSNAYRHEESSGHRVAGSWPGCCALLLLAFRHLGYQDAVDVEPGVPEAGVGHFLGGFLRVTMSNLLLSGDSTKRRQCEHGGEK